MFHSGLISITFRHRSPEEIAMAASKNGLRYIEWGSDLHALCDDEQQLAQIVALQKNYGISCCSYGTNFRPGLTS